MAHANRETSSVNPLGQARVRVTGTRLGRFIEFEFSLDDDDLTVELIMPLDAFECFCRDQAAILLPPTEAARIELERLAWRHRRLDLYRASAAP